MDCRKILIELQAPLDPGKIVDFYVKTKSLIARTGRVSIASKPFGRFAAGFELSYNLASYLLERHPQLDVLFHVTCYDLNKVNIRARLSLLRLLKIKRLLVVSGDGYGRSQEPPQLALQYRNSHELAHCILQEFNWFESIAVAAYPGGNGSSSLDNEQEYGRLLSVLQAGVREVYTQCVFEPTTVGELDRLMRSEFPRVRMTPSVALFEGPPGMDRIARLTRASGTKFQEVRAQIERISRQESRRFSLEFLVALCRKLADSFDSIDLCLFGQIDLAESLIDQLEAVG